MTQWTNCIPAHDGPSLLLFLGNIPFLGMNGGPAGEEGLHFEERMQSVVHNCAQVLGWSLALKGALN